jgi:hypothetical protein
MRLALVALLLAGARFELTPPAPVSTNPIKWDPAEIAYYVIERDLGDRTEAVTTIQVDAKDPHFDRRSGKFVFVSDKDDAAQPFRITAVDRSGNASSSFTAPAGLQCSWKLSRDYQVETYCEGRCSCAEVRRRLDFARSELVDHSFVKAEGFDKALHGYVIAISNSPSVTCPPGTKKGEVCYGVVDAKRRRILLARDMRAALHELVHVNEPPPWVRRDIYDHPAWDADPALQEIDGRYLQKFRDRAP